MDRIRALRTSLIGKYLTNTRLVLLILFLIILVGINSFINLPRNLNPEINIPIVIVSTVLPGGSPEDVEQLLTIPLEDSLQGLDKVKSMQSTSRDSVSLITIQFESGVDGEKARTDAQSKVDSVTIPTDAVAPKVQKLDFENQPVWTFILSTKGDEASLFRFAKELQTSVKDLPEVDRVEVAGLQTTEVEVIIKPETISSYGVNPLQLNSLISNSLKSYPSGSVRTEGSNFAVSIDPQVSQISDLRSLRLNLNGANVALSDIASVSERSKVDQAESFISYPDSNSKPQKAVTFNVFRVKTVNIDTSVAAAQQEVETKLAPFNNQFKVETILNTASEIDKQFSELTRDFLITIFLVMVVLFIFLGARQALVSAASAPLSFLISFTIMKLTGITLNFLSLFSLLLSLGLLVDDTVVVISAITAYHRVKGTSARDAALMVWRDFLIPVFTTTITTVWAFLPLLLSTGIIGEFIKPIPIIVSTALISSFFVSIFLTLPLIIILLEPNIPPRVKFLLNGILGLSILGFFYLLIPKGNQLFLVEMIGGVLFFLLLLLIRQPLQRSIKLVVNKRFTRVSSWNLGPMLDHGLISFEGINNRYRYFIERVISTKSGRVRILVMVAIFFVFAFALFPLGYVKNEFFPKQDSDILYLSLELPAGTNLTVTKQQALALIDDLKTTEQTKFVTADIGQGFSADSGIGGAENNNILFTLTLTDHKSRHTDSGTIAAELRAKYQNFSSGKLTVQEISGGPPAGADVQIKLLGDDLTTLDSLANKTVTYLQTQPGVTNVDKSIKSGTSKLSYIPDKASLVQHQISVDMVGLYLRTYASGFNLSKNKFAGSTEDQDINLRFFPSSGTAQDLSELMIPNQSGGFVPLHELGRIVLVPNPTLITREDGKRTISVSSSVAGGSTITEVNQKLVKFVSSDLNLPPGYSWKTGGANEENEQSVQSILQAMILSFLLIIVTMVVQFSSFRKALIVMLVIPLSISGVFIIFALTNTPLSFPALIGVLALFGIVVKNSILVVDKITQNELSNASRVELLSDDNERADRRLIEAIGEASAARLEPIALTSFCTIVGLIPITLSDPLWRGLGGAIIAGLTFSGTIMLFFIPVVYYLLFRPKSPSIS